MIIFVGARIGTALLLGLVLGVAVFFIFYAGTGEGAVLTVDDDPGGGDFRTIQAAIDAAEDGDTIRVFDGEYDERIVIEKSLSLIGNGSDSTILDGMSTYLPPFGQEDGSDGITITADWVNLSGFNITRTYRRNRYNAVCILVQANHSAITDNILSETSYGIEVIGNFNSFSNNKIRNDAGVRVRDCRNLTFRANEFASGGIRIEGESLEHWASHDIASSNTIKRNPIHYFANADNIIVPSGGAQIILANCTNMTIRDQIIQEEFEGVPIELAYTSNTEISNNSIILNSTYWYGIKLLHSDNIFISNNNISSPQWAVKIPIELDHSDHNRVINNTIITEMWSNYGVSLLSSHHNLIQGNVLENQFYGVRLEKSHNNRIVENTLSNNHQWMNSIYLRLSNNNSILKNSIANNYYGYAIQFTECLNSTVSGNLMQGYGMEIKGETVEHWSSHTIDSANTVGNRSMYYFSNQLGGTVPEGAGQIILANCTGMHLCSVKILTIKYLRQMYL